MSKQIQEASLAWCRKNAWSRERCEDMRAISLMMEADEDHFSEEAVAIIEAAAEYMLRARQAFRGGRLNVRGSRHWPDQ